MSTPHLFTPFKLREMTFRNRIFVSPMCQYSGVDGIPQPWHMVHLGSRAVGGAALVMVEASGVNAEGRISAQDLGIYSKAQVEAFKPMTKFISDEGSIPGIQLAHAGRKASTTQPWNGGGPVLSGPDSWTPVAPSAEPFAEGHATPHELSAAEITGVIDAFTQATRNALVAGFQVVEIHAAHGYLLHEFLSPISNKRNDTFGGSLENRMRLPLQVAEAVRKEWPSKWPVFVRISASDWLDGGWDIEQSTALARELKKRGIDLIDCSSGGISPKAKIPVGPGYQVSFSEAIRKNAGIPTSAVGMITSAEQAEQILVTGQADVVSLAREMLRDPYWPLNAAKTLRFNEAPWPKQYGYAVGPKPTR